MTALTVGVLNERSGDEQRVALIPAQVKSLRDAGLEVLVEPGAGLGAWHSDDAYTAAGASLASAQEVIARAGLLLVVGRPSASVTSQLRSGQSVLGMLRPLDDPAYLLSLAQAGVQAICLDLLPRTLSRAQGMDAVTSQANIAGYKAVLVAADTFGRFFPMLVTAAGTTKPASVLVLGAGVAGLQAIGTARRLGAVVSAFDVRPQARDEVLSVGATFLNLGGASAAGEGGYARALTAQEQAAQQEALTAAIAKFDIVITTALVPGRRPPILVTQAAVASMAPGSVIVDLAAGPLGGNVETVRAGQTYVNDNGVTIIGSANLAARVPTASSAAYSRNISSTLLHMVHDGQLRIDLTDEVQAGVVVTTGGALVHPMVTRQLESMTGNPAPALPTPAEPTPAEPDSAMPTPAQSAEGAA